MPARVHRQAARVHAHRVVARRARSPLRGGSECCTDASKSDGVECSCAERVRGSGSRTSDVRPLQRASIDAARRSSWRNSNVIVGFAPTPRRASERFERGADAIRDRPEVLGDLSRQFRGNGGQIAFDWAPTAACRARASRTPAPLDRSFHSILQRNAAEQPRARCGSRRRSVHAARRHPETPARRAGAGRTTAAALDRRDRGRNRRCASR